MFAIATVLAISGIATAQSSPEVAELRSEVAKLKATVEQQQKMLEQLMGQKQTAVATEPANAAAVGTPLLPAQASVRKTEAAPLVTAGWDKNRPVLRTADGNFEANFGGLIHLDYRGYESGIHPVNTFLIRRARLIVDGRLSKYYEYRLETDFADTSTTLLRDGFIRVHRFDPFQLTFGQFKEPFSQEELRGDPAQDFVERSMVDNLAPQRSPGFMVSGVVSKGLFEYQTGIFNGKGLLANNTNGTPESVARVRFTPGKNSKNSWINQFSFGSAAAMGRNAGASARSILGQTESKSTTFFAADTVNGSLYRADGEVTWLKGPMAVRSEYGYVSQSRAGLGAAGSNLPDVESSGFMAQATYLLTGEKKPDNGAVVPKRNLFGEGQQNGFGAWELKFRYAYLDINDHTAKSNRAASFFFGTNWYMNRFVKNVFDVGFEQFRDPSRTPNPSQKNFFFVLNRIQVAF
jgi:phosphate-selective porin OprO/OprP